MHHKQFDHLQISILVFFVALTKDEAGSGLSVVPMRVYVNDLVIERGSGVECDAVCN